MSRTESAEPASAPHHEETGPAPAGAPSWERAAFLHERAVPPADSPIPLEALAEAEERAARWQAATLADDETFRARLALAGLDRNGFVRLLAAERVRLRPEAEAESHAWRDAVEAVRTGRYDAEPIPPLGADAEGDAGPVFPFPRFLEPFVRLGLARLREGIEERRERGTLVGDALGEAVTGAFLRALVRRLGPQCLQMLTLELNVARLMEILRGETAEERFAFFAREHLGRADVRLALMDEYAPLTRLMATTAVSWADAVLEFTERLEADRPRLAHTFGQGRDLGALAAVHAGGSDAHRGGRGVVVAEFASGLRLVYKPTPLAAGARFQHLLGRLNALGLPHPHRTLAVLDRGEYGWMEFVRAAPCASEGQVRRFYRRQGSLVAILHLLKATDFHFENLIAAGEHPVPVDLESLFHHDLPVPGADGGSAGEEAQRFLRHSVLRSAILPVVMRGRDGRLAADVSALGGEGGQEAATHGLALDAAATDRMQVVEGRVLTHGGQNLPTLNGAPVEMARHVEDVVAGFEETYALLAAHRDEIAPELAAFAGDEVRNLLRMTRHYSLFVREGHHPDFLRDALDRGELMDRLWAEATVRPELARIAPSERDDLLGDDVPAFSARPGERHLWDSRGRRIDDFFPAPSLDGVLAQLSAMDEGEMRRQSYLVRTSIASVALPRPAAPVAFPEATTEEDDERAMLEAATAVGEHLVSVAIHGREGDATWVALQVEPDAGAGDAGRLALAPAGPHLYEGVAGIALFLATLGEEAGRDDFRALAEAALATARGEWRRGLAAGFPATGAFLGRASLPYLLLHLAALWKRPELLREALGEIPALERMLAADREMDLTGGAAGCAVVLLHLHRATGDADALRVARLCGERLLAGAVETGGGLAWPVAGGAPMAGMSHGAAGIAWALLELAAATGDGRFRDAARRGIAWERAAFDPAGGGWSHRRVAWCHGASSIALGRALSAPLLDDDAELAAELRRGAEAILAQGPTPDPCLCHGTLGNADLLLHLGRPEWRETARAWGAAVARDVAAVAERRAFPQYVRSTGLMAGIAGGGMGLLRLRRPEGVASVLALGGPVH